MITVKQIGDLQEKYSIFYKDEAISLLDHTCTIRVKFNCLSTKTISNFQLSNYLYFKDNIFSLDSIIKQKLTEYAKKNGCNSIDKCIIRSVEFTNDNSFFLADVPWDEEQGIAILFDKSGKIEIVESDEVL